MRDRVAILAVAGQHVYGAIAIMNASWNAVGYPAAPRSVTRLSERLLNAASAEEADRVCSELYEAFRGAAAAAARAAEEPADTNEMRLPGGLALSPASAANCLLDGRRTQAFVRGALDAIRDAVQRFAPAVVDVLYAGTGPFAPLAFLLMPFVDKSRVQFTLLDVHPQSTESVAAIVHALGVADYVRAIVCADATTYRHPSSIHVLISETMQRSLANEPFVAILRNLRPQMAPSGLIVPERVTIDLALLDAATEQARWNRATIANQAFSVLGKVFEVDAAGERPHKSGATTINVTPNGSGDDQWLALVTRIVVYRNHLLEPYASGLTTPEILWSVSPVRRELTLEFRYLDGDRPGIEWSEPATVHSSEMT